MRTMSEYKWINDAFLDAVNDYFVLVNRGYTETPSLKLVGDRYRLSGTQRNILFRGITSQNKASSRKTKLSNTLKEKKIYLDGYNILFTIMNYLLGKAIFIGNDGILRDAGAIYGKIEDETVFYKACDVLFDFIKKKNLQVIEIFLDESIPGCTSHAYELEKKMPIAGIKGKISLAKHADNELKKINDGVIATSDSGIIDAAKVKIFDLARCALEAIYDVNAYELMAPLKI
ncbi:MAG: DUF434 domain-containing protein, partial [Acidobacteria bacterium]|nr:DUF434 domain-containing protein [Acidobacteriota bacterium]